MKFLILNLFSVYIISIFSVVSGAPSGDCIQLNDFLKRDANTECCGKHVTCDTEGNIIKLDLSDFANNLDFSHFPVFKKLITLEGSISNINNNELPSSFFDQPMLNELTIYKSNIISIPNNINNKCPVTQINLEHNELADFPYQFSVLPNLQH
eukprot:jgi/Orpsp1_1/1190207/evm.model.d7180000077427.1